MGFPCADLNRSTNSIPEQGTSLVVPEQDGQDESGQQQQWGAEDELLLARHGDVAAEHQHVVDDVDDAVGA